MSELFDQRKATPAENKVFGQIQRALISAAPKTIRFTYRKEDGSLSERHVEPYEVQGGKNQLVAFDLDKNEIRRFVLAGIENVTLGESFNARYPIKIML